MIVKQIIEAISKHSFKKMCLCCLLSVCVGTNIKAQMADSQQTPDVGEERRHLVVWHKDGSRVAFSLSETPKISYLEEKVVITASSTVEYDFQSIKKMTYGMEDADGINNPVINKKKPFVSNGETISFISADNDLRVKFVTLDGIVIKELLVKKGESSSFSLSSFPMNIYLIVVNGVTYKIKTR